LVPSAAVCGCCSIVVGETAVTEKVVVAALTIVVFVVVVGLCLFLVMGLWLKVVVNVGRLNDAKKWGGGNRGESVMRCSGWRGLL
jgi:hypothetical protein